MSPILLNGPKFSEMIIWLNTTLPVNSYYVDGFDSGDNYLYMWGNKEAPKTYTDDDNYFVHRGKIDIFNFSRQPKGNDTNLISNFIFANNIKKQFIKIINNGRFVTLKATNSKVFAYAISFDNNSIIVIGNLDFRQNSDVTVSVPKLKRSTSIIPIKIENIPLIEKNSIITTLSAGEIQVLYTSNFEVR